MGKKINVKDVIAAFDDVKILKGQYINIATSDGEGNPSVAPIGSMRMVDESTVHILRGFLPRTMQNLKRNPKATFTVCLRPSILDFLSIFKADSEEDVLGYQVYCSYKGATSDRRDIDDEGKAICKRVPWMLRGMFRKFIDKNIKQKLVFSVDHIRAIGPPDTEIG